MGGTGQLRRSVRLRTAVLLAAAILGTALLAACGSSESSDANEGEGTYRVAVTDASFPALQRVGSTALLRLAVKNEGKRTIPALTVTIDVKGKDGEDSAIPFAVHDPAAGLANGDRPVWVLAAKYPRRADSDVAAGATTATSKTFDFGPLKANDETAVVWKLSAVRPGKYTLVYGVDAGLGGGARAVASGGGAPGGSFATEITTALPETEVDGNGEIVEVGGGEGGSTSG